MSMTIEGKARQMELVRMMNRSRRERFFDGIRNTWRNIKPSTVRIIEEVIGGTILTLLGFWLGRITSP